MTTLQGDDWEYVNGTGFSKAVDVTSVAIEMVRNHGEY